MPKVQSLFCPCEPVLPFTSRKPFQAQINESYYSIRVSEYHCTDFTFLFVFGIWKEYNLL